MAGPIRIYNDTQNRKLVKSNTDRTDTTFPTLRQGETPTLQIYFIDNTGVAFGSSANYINLVGSTIKLGIMAGAPTGGTDTLIAYQDTWTGITNGFQGTLSCNTVGISNALGSASSLGCTVEIEVTEPGGSPIKYYQGGCSIQAAVIDDANPQPAPATQYLSKAEAQAGYLKKIEDNGIVWEARSPSGTFARQLGVDDLGQPIDNIITL